MIFDTPNPEDLDFEFSLENTGCVFTVMKYREFNDTLAQKLFPCSSADYVSSDTYTLPDSYFRESFWRSEKERLQRLLSVWVSNEKKLNASACNRTIDDFKFVDCKDRVGTLISMCEWLLNMCWEGDRSKPPMPLYLYKARLSELKDANLLGMQCLNELSCGENSEEKLKNDVKAIEMRAASQKPTVGADGSLSLHVESASHTPHWRVTFLQHINETLNTLDKLANTSEDVEEAFAFAVEIRQSIKEGKSCREDLCDKLKFLNEAVDLLEKRATDPTSATKHRNSIKTPVLCTHASTSDTDSCSNGTVQLSSGRRNTATKRGRKTVKHTEDDEYVEKRRNLSSALHDSDDDLVSRVKRGQRTRRPTRTFTPLWTLSPSPPPPPKTSVSSKAAPSVGKGPPVVMKRTSPPSSLTTTLVSPDSGRPSSNESTVNVTAATNEKQSSSSTTNQEDTSDFEKSVTTTCAQSLPSESFSHVNTTPLTTTSSVPTLVSSASFSTPTTSLALHRVPQPPPLNLDEQSLLALWKEKIQLGDVRITLLNMLATDSICQYHFIPLMVETIDKATAALDNKDMIAYAMHRAAIEVGCTELGNIMRSYNPVDPASQIATLATAMGLNPAPFTSMLQPSSLNTGLSPNLLVDLHEAATVVAAREKLTGSYSLPVQTSDSYQGYTERDITKYLL